jgi:hypothetical protein
MATKNEEDLAQACNQVIYLAAKVSSEMTGTHGASVGEAAGLAFIYLAAAAQGAGEYFNSGLKTEAYRGDKKI